MWASKRLLTWQLVVQEYYTNILKKLKNVGASSKQTDFYV